MTALLYTAMAMTAYGIGAAAVCALSNRQASGMPAVVRNAAQWALRRAIGARTKTPRHTTKGAIRHV